MREAIKLCHVVERREFRLIIVVEPLDLI